MIVTKKRNVRIRMAHIIVTVDEVSLVMLELHAFALAMTNVLMAIVPEHLIIDTFVILDGLVNHVRYHVDVIIIPLVLMVRAFVINVNIGQKVNRVKNVDREAMEMQHLSKKDADHVNVMVMEMKRSEFVTFKPVNAFVNTILKDTIVKNVVPIIMEIR